MNYFNAFFRFFSLKNISNRYSVFALVPLMVLCTYAYLFGMGELLVHSLAIGQYTLLAFVAYAISNSLSSGASSTEAYKKAMDSDTVNNNLGSAVVFGVIVISRAVTFLALAISYTWFMTSSKSLL
jgi:multisubunit Na+/H+ antiporter MnhC subunit